jgi:GH24 family phage-related lysozyme (muramidase)
MHLRHGEAYQTDDKLARPKFWPDLKRKVSDKVIGKNPLWGMVNPTEEDKKRQGMNVRQGPSTGTDVVGWLPRGARLTLKPDSGGHGHWQEIASVEGSQMLFNPTTNPANSTAGWIAGNLLDALPTEPVQYDSVYIPPQPIPIAADERVGHLGEYLRYHPEVLNQTKQRPLTHLELFGGAEVRHFIGQSQRLAWAKNVEAHKTLLLVEEGARLVQATEPDLELKGEGIRLSQDSPKEGLWVKVRRGALDTVARSTLSGYKDGKYADGSIFYSAVKVDGSEMLADAFNDLSQAEQGHYPNRKVFKPSGSAWIKREEPMSANAIRELTHPLAAWSAFPLQVEKMENAPAAYLRVASVKRLKTLQDDQGHRWWKVDVGVLDGNTSRSEQGWACEEKHVKVRLCSPWEWPGFNAISLDKTTPSEWAERLLTHHYKPDNELLKKLYEVMDLNADGDLSPDELKQAWKESWLSQTLSRLIVLHDSEWGLAMSEWDKLDPLLLENEGVKKLFPNWVEEKKRIKKLRWWDEVKGHHGFPNSIQVYHFHPLGVIENFAGETAANTLSEKGFEFIYKHEAWASVSNHLHWPGGASGVTLGPGYDMKERASAAIVSDMQNIGVPSNIAASISAGTGLTGSQARGFANNNHGIVNLTKEQEMELLRNIVPEYEKLVNRKVTIELQQHEFDALVCFAYNPGGRLNKVTNYINTGKIQDAMDEIKKVIISGGTVMPGLVTRRDHEVDLYVNGNY